MNNRWTVVICTLCWWAASPSGSLAQEALTTSGHESPAPDASRQDKERAGNFEGLPSWLRLGVEFRGRTEFNLDSEHIGDDPYLNRLRLRAAVQPVRWMRFFFEAQDARTLHLNSGPALENERDPFDVRQAYVEFGNSEHGFHTRLGRQELSVGDERLVGADNYWDPFGRSFDAARLSFTRERLRVEAFTGFFVKPADHSLDRWDRSSRLSGITARFKTKGGGVIEPYLLWKRAGDTLDLMEHHGHRDVASPGIRAQGDLPRSLDYNIEVTLQRGHVVEDSISAWGGHWEIGWKPLGRDVGPRLGVEYNYASGDAEPEDGHYGTLDDLYSSGFNKYGMRDPVIWRNISYPAFGADIPVTRRWTLYGGWRSYWLATVRDGFYSGGETYMVRNPAATSSHVGGQVLVSAGYIPSERWRVSAGYGHLFPGGYCRQSGCATNLRTLYLLSSFSF